MKANDRGRFVILFLEQAIFFMSLQKIRSEKNDGQKNGRKDFKNRRPS
jgi:hypothetical protein